MSEINKVAATREEMEKAAEALRVEFVGRGAAACEYIESLFKDGDKLTKGYRSQFKIANLAQDILGKRVTVEGKMAI